MTPWARARYDNDNGDELPVRMQSRVSHVDGKRLRERHVVKREEHVVKADPFFHVVKREEHVVKADPLLFPVFVLHIRPVENGEFYLRHFVLEKST